MSLTSLRLGPRYRALAAILIALVLAVPASGALAQGKTASSPIELALTAAQLKPGEWVWAPQIAPSGPVMVYVDLSKQIATIYRNGVRIGVSTISSGKKGYETPTGVFTILEKDPDHRSRKYNNAPMFFQLRLTWEGVALHAGGLPGYPESHGCIHLPYALAKALFQITNLGGTVIVDDGNSVPMRVAGGDLLLPLPPSVSTGLLPAVEIPPGGEFDWHPELSPTGPVTIIVSRSDQLIVVLRNGVEIGRSKAVLPNTDFATHVLTLTTDASGTPQWIYVGVPGHADDAGKTIDNTVASQAVIPQGFRDAVRAILQPGSTVLVTQSPINADTTGEKLIIMNSDKAPQTRIGGKP